MSRDTYWTWGSHLTSLLLMPTQRMFLSQDNSAFQWPLPHLCSWVTLSAQAAWERKNCNSQDTYVLFISVTYSIDDEKRWYAVEMPIILRSIFAENHIHNAEKKKKQARCWISRLCATAAPTLHSLRKPRGSRKLCGRSLTCLHVCWNEKQEVRPCTHRQCGLAVRHMSALSSCFAIKTFGFDN